MINGLTFYVDASERVGIVGRTGAGKPTLALALFASSKLSSGPSLSTGSTRPRCDWTIFDRVSLLFPRTRCYSKTRCALAWICSSSISMPSFATHYAACTYLPKTGLVHIQSSQWWNAKLARRRGRDAPSVTWPSPCRRAVAIYRRASASCFAWPAPLYRTRKGSYWTRRPML